MNERRRRDAATATVGLAGVATAGGLRHAALVDAYRENTPKPLKRPRMAAELRMLKHPAGRGKYLAGAGLGALAIPPAAVGTTRLLDRRRSVAKRDDRRRSFIAEGISGVRESVRQRNETMLERPPAKFVAGNYLAGAALGSAAGGVVHGTLSRTRFPGVARSGLAATAGVLAGAASLPAQRKLTERASHGRYTVTATGVRRQKARPVRPSSRASLSRVGHTGQVEKMSPRQAATEIGARVGAKWTMGWGRAADLIEHYPAKHRPPAKHPVKIKASKLVATGRNKLGETARAISYDAASLNDKDKLIREVATGQGRLGVAKAASDPGAGMSRAQRRALVTAAGVPVPFLGDAMQAAQAARLSPKKYRHRTAAQNYAGGTLAGLAGNAAGAAGAVALANSRPGFRARAEAASDRVDRVKAASRRRVGLRPSSGASATERFLSSPKTPKLVKTGARAAAGTKFARHLASNPKVAAIGALAGGSIAGQAGQQITYSRIMTRDDRYRNANHQARHGTRVAKAGDKPHKLSQRENKQLAERKRHGATMSAVTSTMGIGALTALGVSRLHPKLRRVSAIQTPLLTTSAGIGGINGYNFANVQRKEAQQQLAKAMRLPRVPAMRRGFLRQTRTSTGLKVSSVRGGLIR